MWLVNICVQDWKKGCFRLSCNNAERVEVCHSIMIGILSCTYTQVGKTVSVILPTGVYINTRDSMPFVMLWQTLTLLQYFMMT